MTQLSDSPKSTTVQEDQKLLRQLITLLESDTATAHYIGDALQFARGSLGCWRPGRPRRAMEPEAAGSHSGTWSAAVESSQFIAARSGQARRHQQKYTP